MYISRILSCCSDTEIYVNVCRVDIKMHYIYIHIYTDI